MKLTPTQLRQTADAIEALKAGKRIQHQMITGEWLDYDNDLYTMNFNGDVGYRVKPEPVSCPWSKPEDVPGPVCWIRLRANLSAEMMVTAVCAMGVHAGGALLEWASLKDFEYAAHRCEWQPCTVDDANK